MFSSHFLGNFFSDHWTVADLSFIFFADWFLEEIQPDISFLSPSQTYFTLLLLHSFLHHPSHDNVYS